MKQKREYILTYAFQIDGENKIRMYRSESNQTVSNLKEAKKMIRSQQEYGDNKDSENTIVWLAEVVEK